MAIAIVLISHLGNYGMHVLPFAHDAVGKVGVWIFFVLSAFLLTRRLCEQLSEAVSLWSVLARYAVHRIFRIYPLLLIVLVAHTLVGELGLSAALRNLLLLEGWDELWAIPVEFKWYLAMPAIAWVAATGRRVAVEMALLGAIALSTCAMHGDAAEVFSNEISLFPKVAPFLVGSLLAIALNRRRSGDASSVFSRAGSVLAVGALLAGAFFYRQAALGRLALWVMPWLSAFIACASAAVLAASLRPGWLHDVLGTRLPVWLGEISFSLYLSHMFVIKPLLHLATWMPPLALGWIAVGLQLVLATLLHRFVELPGIRWGSRLGRWVGRRVDASTS